MSNPRKTTSATSVQQFSKRDPTCIDTLDKLTPKNPYNYMNVLMKVVIKSLNEIPILPGMLFPIPGKENSHAACASWLLGISITWIVISKSSISSNCQNVMSAVNSSQRKNSFKSIFSKLTERALTFHPKQKRFRRLEHRLLKNWRLSKNHRVKYLPTSLCHR